MRFTYASLDPVAVTKPGPHNASDMRTYTGIPGIERSPGGRLFAVYYTGGTSECNQNYVVLEISDDRGETWSPTLYVVDPPNPCVRAFDSTLWLARDQSLYWFWAQGCGGEEGEWSIADGLGGVWCSILKNPDDAPEQFQFTSPRRIAHGVMLNKPTVLADGTWLMPCSVWTSPDVPTHESLHVKQGAFCLSSMDQGRTFQCRGGVNMENAPGGASYDEHMFVEQRDGTLTCYLRGGGGIAVSVSRDAGRTWSLPTLSERIRSVSSRFFIRRLQSGNLLLVVNDSETQREKLTAFLSLDDGVT